ncbi:CPBP family intramembrane glutamic endopeptidase [uncultured Brevibacillus sp.]|uniref:CPBP family intramembrane glutamic endopeptidase n=1 Tax=uncultured Brevibacillus sp. TaxID=169970 RepID=UPI002591F965|nr:CPBP family intramembrane glutamic endopeptidase [uncultured Brevibacillus sp.]
MKREVILHVETYPSLCVRESILFAILSVLLLLPLIATWGQFITSGFLLESIKVSFLFWPQATWSFFVQTPGWLIFGAFTLLYLAGIYSLIRRKKLGVAFLFVLVGFLLEKTCGFVFQTITGWVPTNQMDPNALVGKANLLIFAMWHNPVWEEFIFRGIPLVFLLLVYRKRPFPTGAIWFYLLVPSIVFAIYHVPGHGMGTLLESFLIGILWAWAASRWGLIAPIILHIFADAMQVPTLAKMKKQTSKAHNPRTFVAISC